MFSNASHDDLVRVEKVEKSYGKFQAVKGVTFGIDSNQCFGLLGEFLLVAVVAPVVVLWHNQVIEIFFTNSTIIFMSTKQTTTVSVTTMYCFCVKDPTVLARLPQSAC